MFNAIASADDTLLVDIRFRGVEDNFVAFINPTTNELLVFHQTKSIYLDFKTLKFKSDFNSVLFTIRDGLKFEQENLKRKFSPLFLSTTHRYPCKSGESLA